MAQPRPTIVAKSPARVGVVTRQNGRSDLDHGSRIVFFLVRLVTKWCSGMCVCVCVCDYRKEYNIEDIDAAMADYTSCEGEFDVISSEEQQKVLDELQRQELVYQLHPLRQPAKLKPSFDPQQTWPPPKLLLLNNKMTSK